ncbi:MAG: hypothetical protein IKG11_02115 [Atopobiaceae bacterium]|nr:hypothetical protein [Atopobiaceae bacterium]MDO4403693.1 hypothetical protein [Atopobiaceae bacterium]
MSNESFEQRVTTFMRGRNGADEITYVTVALSVLLLFINLFARTRVLAILAFALAVYACWRIMSKSVVARNNENRKFLTAIGPAAYWINNPKATFEEYKNYKHLTCPSCGKKMRVPRGKGNLRVTCPACGNKFEAKS